MSSSTLELTSAIGVPWIRSTSRHLSAERKALWPESAAFSVQHEKHAGLFPGFLGQRLPSPAMEGIPLPTILLPLVTSIANLRHNRNINKLEYVQYHTKKLIWLQSVSPSIQSRD
jgi:hypothetical protein